MKADRQQLRRDLALLLEGNAPAAALGDAVAHHFPAFDVFRENDDLIVVAHETNRLLVRRVGPDSFRTSKNAAASGSTNLLDVGGHERDLDELVGELADFAEI